MPADDDSSGRTAIAPGVSLGLTLALAIVFFLYLFWFLLIETVFADRLGTCLGLLFNADIYWAYCTGSPTGAFHLTDRWPILVGWLFHVGLAWGLGNLLLSSLTWASRTTLESIALAMGIGLAAISTYTLIIGWLHLFWLQQAHAVLLAILSIWGMTRGMGSVAGASWSTDPSTEIQRPKWTDWTAGISVPFAVLILLASVLPPWEFDVREYHLQVPKEWYQSGGIDFLPHNVYGNMPLGTEMHALFAMLYAGGADDWWWGSLIGKTVSGSFALWCGLGLFCVGNRLFGRWAGMTAAVAWVSTPWVIANSIIGYNEVALGAHVVLSLLMFLVLRDSSVGTHSGEATQSGATRQWLLLGLLLGGAVSCKYTAVPFVGVPAALVVFAWGGIKSGWGVAWRITAWVVLGVALMSGFWFLKNFASCGNPFYPLLGSVFEDFRSSERIQQWNQAHAPSGGNAMSSVLEKAISLIVKYQWLSPIVAPLALFSIFHRKRKRVLLLASYLLFVGLLWFLATHRLERFLLPFYPLVCLLAGAGWDWNPDRGWRTFGVAVLLGGCLLNLLFSSSRLVGDVRIFASLESLDIRRLTAEDYSHPDGRIVPLHHLSPTIAWLNENHREAKVLFFGECRPWSAEFSVIYNTCFDECETRKRLAARTVAELRESLFKEGITHVLVNASEWNRFRETYGYDVDHPDDPFTVDDVLRWEGTVLRRVASQKAVLPADPGVILLEVITDRILE